MIGTVALAIRPRPGRLLGAGASKGELGLHAFHNLYAAVRVHRYLRIGLHLHA